MAKIHHPNSALKKAVKFVVSCADSHSVTPVFMDSHMEESCVAKPEKRKHLEKLAKIDRPAIQHCVAGKNGHRFGGHTNFVCLFLLASGVATEIRPQKSDRITRAGEFIRRHFMPHQALVEALRGMSHKDAREISAWFEDFMSSTPSRLGTKKIYRASYTDLLDTLDPADAETSKVLYPGEPEYFTRLFHYDEEIRFRERKMLARVAGRRRDAIEAITGPK